MTPKLGFKSSLSIHSKSLSTLQRSKILENMEDMDPDTLDSISIGAVLKRETVMEKVKLLCAFVEEELSWIVQFFHDVLNKEVTASSGKIGRIFGAIAAATGDLTKSPVHQFDHGCFLNHSASWFVLLSFSVFSGTISAATQRNSRAQVDLHPFFPTI